MSKETNTVKAIATSNMDRMYLKYNCTDDVVFYIDKIKEKYNHWIDKGYNENDETKYKLMLCIQYYDVLYDEIWSWLENAQSKAYHQFNKLPSKKKNIKAKQLGDKFYDTDWWRETRKKILKRDKYSCVECGNKGELHVHHVKYKHKSNSKNNLVTLCKFCHAKKHPVNGKNILR